MSQKSMAPVAKGTKERFSSGGTRAVLKGPVFFFLLRTALKDRPNRQLPTANRQPPPTANRQPPPTMVEHMECPRAFLGKLVPEHFFFFFSVKDRPGWQWGYNVVEVLVRFGSSLMVPHGKDALEWLTTAGEAPPPPNQRGHCGKK